MKRHESAGEFLSGYRVLDFSDARGAFCVRLLADMGAEVIPVKNPPLGAREEEEFRRLAAASDILVESQAPGYLEKLGLGYAELASINPRLIMAAITDFGQDGPYRDYRSCALVAAALGGWLSVTGAADTPPLQPFGELAYRFASLFAANGILLALRHRHDSGKGQYLDVSALESVAATLDHVLVRYYADGVVAGRRGSLHWDNAFRVFSCRDGYVLLSIFWQWETLVNWLESEGMAADLAEAKYQDREKRRRYLEHIIAVLDKWTLTHTADELVATGQAMHFPWARVNSLAEVMRSPQLTVRRFFVAEKDAAGAVIRRPGLPWKTN